MTATIPTSKLSLKQLVAVYNAIVEADFQVKSFRDKRTALTRVNNKLAEGNLVIAVEHTEDSIAEVDGMFVTPKSEKTKGTKNERNLFKFADDATIEVLVDENPKRLTAAKRFELYKTVKTVAEYRQAVIDAGFHPRFGNGDITWDVDKGFIKVTNPKK